jgi:hypothetical protein
MILMAPCIIDFIRANGLRGPVGGEGALDTPGPLNGNERSRIPEPGMLLQICNMYVQAAAVHVYAGGGGGQPPDQLSISNMLCDASSVADPGCLSRIQDPDFYPSRIPDLGSRIQKHQQKRGVKKNLLSYLFMPQISQN